MRKILFLYYPLKVHYNHGISLLTSILRNKGIEVEVAEINQLTDVSQIVEENKIDFIGFSIVTSSEYNVCLPHMIEAKKTGISVLVGGVYVRRGSYIDPDAADYICRGEGEILADFILEGKTEIFEIPYLHENLDELPLPDYSKLTGWEFDREVPFLKGKKIIPYHSSRGCPYQCSFCEVRFQPGKIRIKSTIRKDMDFIDGEYHPDLFHIMDELLPYYSEAWRKSFDGNPYSFMSYIRADISNDQLEFLISNGLKVAIFGIESGDEQYRNEVLKKNLLDTDIQRTISLLQARGIFYIPFFMMGAPYETEEIKNKTVEMAKAVGGFPVIWQYEDLEKRVFSVEPGFLRRYAARVGDKVEEVKKFLNDSTVNVISREGCFIAYQIIGKGMFIHHLWGNFIDDKELVDLCKMYGVDKYYGLMRKNFPKLDVKFGVKEYGSVVGKEMI